MGKREIGELEVGELIVMLLISEICSIPIDDPSVPLMNAILPVIFIVSAEIILSFIKNKSLKLKKVLDGESVFLIYKRRLNQKALRDNRISIEEFFCSLRQNGIGALSDVEYCLLEPNGKISIIESDKNASFDHVIITDGEVDTKNLNTAGYDEKWLNKAVGGKAIKDIFLLTVNDDGKTNIIIKEEKKK
jgi:uncharacterized membrane protein YcaP (DUF421 family)